MSSILDPLEYGQLYHVNLTLRGEEFVGVYKGHVHDNYYFFLLASSIALWVNLTNDPYPGCINIGTAESSIRDITIKELPLFMYLSFKKPAFMKAIAGGCLEIS